MNADCIVCAALSKEEILKRLKSGTYVLCDYHCNPNSMTIYFTCCKEKKVVFGKERLDFLAKMPPEMAMLQFGGVLVATGGNHNDACRDMGKTVFAVFPLPEQIGIMVN